jgi:hypothetical protein
MTFGREKFGSLQFNDIFRGLNHVRRPCFTVSTLIFNKVSKNVRQKNLAAAAEQL